MTLILRFTSAGATVALLFLLLALVLPGFPVWLEEIAIIACPPLLMLMVTESCGGWLSWCVIQVEIVIVLGNAMLYGVIGFIVSLLSTLFCCVRNRGAA
jgi:hypothetical protein